MNMAVSLLAKKYAQAFLSLFIDEISVDDFYTICAAEQALSHHSVLAFLRYPAIDIAVKKNVLYAVCLQLKLPNSCTKLIDLLARHKRLDLIKDVFVQMCILYKKEKKISDFSISSSHELEKSELEVIKRFLASVTGQDIIYTSKIDKSLIAGIRLQSSEWLWEHSIRQQLARIEKPLIG